MYVCHVFALISLLSLIFMFIIYISICCNVYLYMFTVINLFVNYLGIILSGEVLSI